MSTSCGLRLFAFLLVTSAGIASCGTDQYVVAIVDTSGTAGAGTASSGTHSSGHAGTMSGDRGGMAGMRTASGQSSGGRIGGNIGGGHSGTGREGAGGASDTVGSVAKGGTNEPADTVSGGRVGENTNRGSGGTLELTGGGRSTSENVAGGGAGGVRGALTQRTSLGGSEGSTTTVFTYDSCPCWMMTTPLCTIDEVSGDQACTFDCRMLSGACDQGCPCTETVRLSYWANDAMTRMNCTTLDTCDSTTPCSVVFDKFPPYEVQSSSCLLISIP